MEMDGLSVICAALGFFEIDKNGKRLAYLKGEHCLDNMKDLLRFLRRDDPQTREVFKQVCAWNIVSEHLIPIIEQYPDDRNLVLNAVKVLVFLTMPIEPSSENIPQQIEYLWGLKSSITYSKIVAVIVPLLETPLENLELNSFAEEDWKLVQLILTLFRNLLAIHDFSLLQKAGESACHLLSLRDRFLELLFDENLVDIFIVITQTIEGSSSLLRHDNLLLLEIFHYIFLGHDPELVANAPKKVAEGNTASIDSLKTLMEEEEARRKLRSLHKTSTRHSQFSGTFTRVAMDGSKAVVKGVPSAADNSILKPTRGRGAVEKIVWEHGHVSMERNRILKLLYDLINQFLSGGYNVLMHSILEDIEKEHHAVQNSDIIMFFQVAQFITSFQCFKTSASNEAIGTEEASDLCGPIAATINDQMFSLVISKWRYAFEGLKQTNDFKFLSAAGSLVKTMLWMLELVIKLFPEDSRDAFTVRILLYKLFYDQTDQGMCQFILNLVKSFDSHKQPKSDLADLVESIHIIVTLMENLEGRGTLRVSKKSRKTRKKDATREMSENQTGNSNDETADSNASPKNPSLETEKDESQHKEPNQDADALSCDDEEEEEPNALDEVDFKVSAFISTFASSSIIQNLCWLLKFYKSNTKQTNHHIISMLQRITVDLELSPMLYQLSLLMIFNKILEEQRASPCKDYEHIVTFLRDFIRKMLKKMKTQPLLFVEILFWKSRRECHYINAEYLLHELGHMKKHTGSEEKADKGWQPRRSLADALGDDEADVVISHDLPLHNEDDAENDLGTGPSGRKRRLVLDDEMEIKLKDLYDKFKDVKDWSRQIAQALDPDGRISAAQVSYKLKQLGVLTKKKKENASSLGQPLKTRRRVTPFSKEQETAVKELYEKFKDQRRCSYLIANALSSEVTFTAAQVSRKLKQLGLHLPRRGEMMLRDEEHGDDSDDSDNETLSAFRMRKKRGKGKSDGAGEEDDMDNHGEGSAGDTMDEDLNQISPGFDVSHDVSDHELDDDDDDDGYGGDVLLTQNPLSRRKMKMVVDDEDE